MSGLTVARLFSTNHDSLLPIATKEIASFCIDHRSRQMALFRAKAQGARTICLGSRLLFYSKCTRFTVCLTYSHISLTVYINQ